MKRLRTLSLVLVLVKVWLVSGQAKSKESANSIDIDSKSSSLGLTAYGEPCSDECKPRGFPYTWCHKTPSRNGTWIDRDYCSPAPGVTRYLEPCLDACAQRDQPFYWCKTRASKRGDWDYCSPFGTAGQLCAWSTWGSWSECSPACGPKSSRTRRRRFETESGKVGPCSGEIEQSISQCTHLEDCPVASRPQDCVWSSWGAWSSCSITCGPGPGTQRRTRPIQINPTLGGHPCSSDDSFETVLCSIEEPCPESTLVQLSSPQDSNEVESSTSTLAPDQDLNLDQARFLGRLVDHEHGVSGEVFARSPRTLIIKNFKYDGSGPDAFFWIGTSGTEPSETGFILPYPYTGKFYHYADQDAPVLGQFLGQDVQLTLPAEIEVEQIKWISIWCRRFSVNFGDLIIKRTTESPTAGESSSKPETFAEQPRSINSSFKNKGVNDNTDKGTKVKELQTKTDTKVKETETKTDAEESELPFTVVRVSSTVSHVRPTVELQSESAEETTYATATTPEPQADPLTTTTRRGSRPPFFRPLTKFPDIRIPSLDENPATTTTSSLTSESLASKVRLSIFSRRPNLFHPTPPASATTTAATDVSSTTAASEPTDSPALTSEATADSKTTAAADPTTATESLTSLTSTTGSEAPSESTSAATDPTSAASSTTTEGSSPSSSKLAYVDVTTTAEPATTKGISTTVAPSTSEPSDSTTNSDDTTATVIDKEETATEETATKLNTVESTNPEITTEQGTTIDFDSETDFAAETTPDGTTPDGVSTENPGTAGRAGSRFKDLGSLRKLLAKRRNNTASPVQAEFNRIRANESPFTTPSAVELSTRKRPLFINRFRSTESPPSPSPSSSVTEEPLSEEQRSEIKNLLSSLVSSTTSNPLNRIRRPFTNRFKTTEAPLLDSDPDSENNDIPESTSEGSRTSGSRSRPPFINRLKTAEAPNLDSALDSEKNENLEPTPDSTTSARTPFINRFRTTVSPSSDSIPDSEKSENPDPTPDSTTTARPPLINRFRTTETASSTSNADPELEPEESLEDETSPEASTTGRTRPSFLNRIRTTDAPFSTPSLPAEAEAAEQNRPTLKPFLPRTRSTSTTPEPTQRPLSFFRTRGTRKPFEHSRSTRAPEVSTGDSNKDNVIDNNKDDKPADNLITQQYPDPDYEEEEEEPEATPTMTTTAATTQRKFSPTTAPTTTTFQTTPNLDTSEEATTESFFVTPLSTSDTSEAGYNPCSLSDACGPNAICESPNGVDPICKCPPGFSGIPRDGLPDPAHGCVRTPVRCSEPGDNVCPAETVCLKDYCLPSCDIDVECSLGERCVDGACIKICFYDAHCLAGEFCEKAEDGGGNGVCLSGCRRDTNCPFGQVCKERRCEDGCHFNNDCTQDTACINGTCTDPCRDFTECGANAVCQAVSHAPTCSCPSGLRELNSPYEACVPEGMNLSDLECLRNSDCQTGFECKDWQCKQVSDSL